MRVGIDASCLPLQMAGAGRYICGLVSALSRIDTTNEYFIFLKRRDRKRFSGLGENFHLVTLPNLSRPARIIWEIAAPRQMVQRYRLDVWHSPHYLLPAGLHNVHSVVTFHDLTFFLMPHLYSRTKRRFFQAAIRHAAARADTIVAVSDTTRADTQAVFPDLSPEKLIRVYSGTNGTFKPVTNPAALAHLKTALQTGSKFVLFVGTLEKRKNLGVLLTAFHRLVHNGHPEARLVVVGKPENGLRQTLEAIRSLGLADKVVLPGYLPDADLPVLYSAASLFVYPSQYEGFGFPVVEAMACGTPVLTSNTSGMREISGRSAMQVAPDDAPGWAARMHRVLSDEAFRSSLVRYGLERARRFSWQQTAEEMVEIYSRARSRHPATGVAVRQADPARESPFTGRTPEELSPLAAAILRTLVYSDIFDFPLTEAEIHASLIGSTSTLETVRHVLKGLEMRPFVESSEGYYFLRGRRHLVHKRKERTRASAHLLAANRRVLRLICAFPFVRMVALSGAIAFGNAHADDDIDLFLIVDAKRIWSVYAALAFLLKLLGKRSLICLNYLYGKPDLLVEERDFFVAHQIAFLRPISADGVYQRFRVANDWVKSYLPQCNQRNGSIGVGGVRRFAEIVGCNPRSRFTRVLEAVFGHRLFDVLENIIYRFYGEHIRKRTRHLGDSIRVARDEIRLFTNDHRRRLLREFAQRLQSLERR